MELGANALIALKQLLIHHGANYTDYLAMKEPTRGPFQFLIPLSWSDRLLLSVYQ